MARIAENTVIVDGQEYKPGDVIPDFKSIKCVDTREPRKYQGLSADVSVLNDVIAKYASGGASCFMSDTGEYYEYDRKEKTWKLITNITERGFDAEKAYGALKHMLKNVTVSDEKIQSAVTNYLTVNPVLPGATTEQAQQIEQNKTDVASLKEETGSLKEDLGDLENLKYRKLYDNLFYDFFAIATNKSGNMTEYGNAQHIFVENVYSNGVKLESGNYLVALKLTNISLKRRVNVDASFALCIIDGWSKKYLGDIQYYNGEKKLFVYSIINFTNDNNIKVSPTLILNGGFEPNSEYSFDIDTIAIIKNNTNGLPESILHYGNQKIYPVFDMYDNLSNFKNAYILNKKLVANDTSGTSDVSAQYTVAKMGNTVNKIMLKGIFDTNTTIAIVTEPNGMTNVTDVTKRSIHVTFSASGCSVGYFDNKALTNIKNISWDGDYIGKEVTIGFEISGNVITVYLPNGNTLTVTNEKLISCGGKYALWEHYMGGLNKRIFHSAQFTKIYAEDADGNVLCDDFNRENGSIGISPQGYVYAQFTNENQTGWSF